MKWKYVFPYDARHPLVKQIGGEIAENSARNVCTRAELETMHFRII